MTTYNQYTFLTTNSLFKVIRATSETEARAKFEQMFREQNLVIDKPFSIRKLVSCLWFKNSNRFVTVESEEQLKEEFKKELGKDKVEYHCKKHRIEDHFLCEGVWYQDFESRSVVF